jgi:hypothetical protein
VQDRDAGRLAVYGRVTMYSIGSLNGQALCIQMHPDPDTDPDPAFQVNLDPDTDPFRIQGFDDQKLKKIIQVKGFFDKKLQFTYVQAYRRSLQPSKKITSSTAKNEIY